MAKSSKTANMTVRKTWERISLWLTENWFEAIELPPGAMTDDIASAEESLQLKLPRKLRESLQIHNGSGNIPLVAFDPFRIPFPLLSLSSSISQWNHIQKALRSGRFSGPDFVNEPRGPIAKVWFHPKWVPIVDNQGGDYLFIDLAPAKGGKKGQVISFFRDRGATDVLFESFSMLLNRVADDLEAGSFKADKKTMSLIPVTPNRRRR